MGNLTVPREELAFWLRVRIGAVDLEAVVTNVRERTTVRIVAFDACVLFSSGLML